MMELEKIMNLSIHLLEELLDCSSLEEFSLLQGNANPGRILIDMVSKPHLLNYYGI